MTTRNAAPPTEGDDLVEFDFPDEDAEEDPEDGPVDGKGDPEGVGDHAESMCEDPGLLQSDLTPGETWD